MKGKIIFLGLVALLTVGVASAQTKAPQSIISRTAIIKKYYTKPELETMQKGPLLELYIERIKVLVKTLPYIALVSKPGVTLTDLGIPEDANNTKALNTQTEGMNAFIDVTVDFQRKMVPYADKGNLITAILFYEETLKSLNSIGEN
ncbi:hypothetical protein ACSVH5_10305 [Flavobacterium sp. RSSA_27]|uniref:hypothetical protein n=1 Tax=Flavobacterium sp. RSSA_27 TaxID=3447667 RepID=UPI003F362A9E